MIVHWINLTNGLQAVADYGLTDYRVMRLQSTWCEQKRWEDILTALPDEFLFRLAAGDECRVYDYGARKETPRAVWQGLAWVRFVLALHWARAHVTLTGRARQMGPYFAEQYAKLGRRTLGRLDYYKRWNCGRVPRITAVTGATTHDGDREYFYLCVGRTA